MRVDTGTAGASARRRDVMAGGPRVFAGIDVGADANFCALIDLSRERIVLAGTRLSIAESVRWTLAQRPLVVAIDAPPEINRGLLADEHFRRAHAIELRGGTNRRVCEWRLGIGGCYSTRSKRDACDAWMRTGMATYDAFADRGMRADFGGGGEVVEVHPTFGFRSLLGVSNRGLRVFCDEARLLAPKQSPGSRGHRQRLALLAAVLEPYGVRLLRDSVARLLERSIDWTDAAFAATLALLKWDGHATLVGDPDGVEGAIVVSAVRVPPRVVALA